MNLEISFICCILKGFGAWFNELNTCNALYHIKKYIVDTKFKVYGKITFERLHIIVIQKFKFQKICIKVHNGSNINNTSFKLFDLENAQYQLK
jgi:hypothetical protein